MTRKIVYMIIECALFALTAGLLAASAVRLYLYGSAMQASGDIFYHIYTREKAGEVLWNSLPLITAFAAFTAAGWIFGIRDEKADLPAALSGMNVRHSVKKAVSAKSGRRIKIIRAVVLILAVVLIILGVRNGGLDDMFAKGASICTECIGLG